MPEEIVFNQWVSTDRAQLITEVMTTEDFFQALVEKLIQLKKHHFTAKVQSKHLKDCKDTLSKDLCIVLGDFSENFTCVVQDEIQSFHWVNPQVTLHPYVYYYIKDNDTICSRSLCIISDDLNHNTSAVHAFQKHLVEDIKQVVPEVNKIIYFSDGASSQYKNKKNFVNICQHKSDFGLEAEWNFFASCHGKNACDGIGGTTKRAVTKASLKLLYNDQILDAKAMFQFCSQNITGIQYIYVTKEEIQDNDLKLEKRFETCQKIPQTRSYHRFVPKNLLDIKCYKFSKSVEFDDYPTSCIPKYDAFSFNIKDIVACIYDGKWWIGQIEKTSEENNDVQVLFYHPHGPRTSFQISKDDIVWVPISKILRKLTATEFTTATGRNFNISNKLCTEITQIFVHVSS